MALLNQIGVLKEPNSLVNGISVWEFSNGIAIVEEDDEGHAFIAEAIILKTEQEATLLELLLRRREARREVDRHAR